MALTDYINPYIDQSGNALSPEAIAARRRYAYSMMQQAGDGSPTKANAIGAIARALQGTMAGYMVGQTDKDEQAGLSAQGEMWAKAAEGLTGGSAGPAPVTPSSPVTSAPPPSPGTLGQSGMISPQVSNRFGNWQQGPTPGTSIPAPVQAAQPMAASTAGKIYGADEPSPLDPPSGNARDLLIRTVYGEDPGQSALGVANVIRNRTVNGGFGGNTVPGVVLAKNQFEPWNNNMARSRMAALQPGSPEYNRLGGIVDSAYTGANDPTNGATSFFSPTAQAALGRQPPQWAQGQGQDIGEHRFYGGAPGQPTQLAGPPPTPDSAPPPQQGAQVGQPPSGQPTQGPQQQQMIQGLINTVRDPGTSVYAKRAATQMLQGIVTKNLGAEMQYMPQPDGSVAWFNKLNPNQHGVITDPGMIERVGAMKKAEAQKAEEGKQAAVAPGLTNLNAEITGDIPSKVQAALKMVDSEGTVPVTGIGGALLAMKPGTGAYNLQQTLNQIKSSMASAYINHVKAISPDGRGASTEQVEQYLKSQGLEITDKAALRSSLIRMQGQFSAPGSNAPPVNMTPGGIIAPRAYAGESQTSGGFRIMKVTPPNGG